VDRYALRIGIAFLLYLGTCWGGPLPSIAVGTCKPNLQSYSTIQDAVSNVAAGGTVLVCAGAYPEQVLITKPLTIREVLSGKAAASIITSPKGGLQQSTIDHLGISGPLKCLCKAPPVQSIFLIYRSTGQTAGSAAAAPG
jgi:hypothetical protein